MGDLATLLGIQLRNAYEGIQRDLPAQGYLTPQLQLARGTAGEGGGTSAPNAASGVDNGMLLENQGLTGKSGQDLVFGLAAPPATATPELAHDPVVAPEGLVLKTSGKRAGKRKIYLDQQSPVLNENGVMVNVAGPQGAPFLAPAEPTVVPMGNPPASAEGRGTGANPVPYATAKEKGMFIRHMKQQSLQMLKSIGAVPADVGPEI